MACSTDQENIDVKIPTFKGPAGEIFGSFQEQASYFLDTYWPNWKNYENPKSYIIPPTFKYKRAEVSDQNLEKFRHEQKGKTTRSPHEVISDRQADEAEFLVYNAIQQLIENEIEAPFITIRNLNLKLNFDRKKGKLNGLLTEIFPNLNWDKFREILNKSNAEYDFLLIGPKIGIVVIEVKSSSFKNHFNEDNRFLPTEYKDGLKQLESIDGLIYLLQECTGIPLSNNNCITKILFTPNIEKEKYENWISNLTPLKQKQRVKERLGTVVQWFNEKIFEFGTPISTELYEKYTPVIAAIASIISLSTNGLELNKLNFSEYDMALNENKYLAEQNLLMDKTNKQITASSLLRKASKDVKKYSNVFFLTPDQRKALKGPPYQFIAGAAGTGKTLVLQAKACELLANDQSVVVLSTRGYMWRYKTLFDHYGFTNYKIYDLETKTRQTDLQFRNYLTRHSESLATYNSFIQCTDSFIEQELQILKNSFTEEFECLAFFDNIVIDDAADGRAYLNGDISCLIMRYVQNVIKKNCCWAAIDTCFNNYVYNLLANNKNHNNNKDIFIATLSQVMRCSEEIYKNVYIPALAELEFPSEAAPVLGHKIQGIRVTKITGHFTTRAAALTELWAKIQIEIDLLFSHRIGLKNIAVIVSNDDWTFEDVDCRDFLRDHCKQRWPNHVCEFDIPNGRAEMTSETNLIVNNNSLLITSFTGVSSLEWPVVISVNLLSINRPSNAKEDNYYNYRAMSRATAKLIDITFTCEEPSGQYIEWSSSELDLLIDLFKKYSNVIKNTIEMPLYEMNYEKLQAWDNICREFNESVKNGPKKTLLEIRIKINDFFYDCNNYANNFDESNKPLKPKWFDIFNKIYAFGIYASE